MPKSPPKQGSNRTGIKSGPNAQKTGPKPIAINWDQLAILAGLHCTQEEAAGYLGVSVQTLTNRYALEHEDETFGDFMRRHRDSGKAKLRVMQLESAKAGSVPMQIFLGKNWLNQSDKQEVSGKFTHALTHETLLQRIEERNNQKLIETENDDGSN